MTASRVRPALVAWLLAILVIALSGWVLLPFPRPPTGWEEVAWIIGFGVGFTTIGALLVDRRPHEPVSRITLGIGLIVVAAVGLRALAVALDARPGDLPAAGALAAALSAVLQAIAFLASGSFLLVRFPNGRERGRLSASVDALVVLIGTAAVLNVFAPGRIAVDYLSPTENPIGIERLDPALFKAIGTLALAAYAVSLVLAVVVVARRYRRSDPVARAQIRWVAAAGLLPVVLAPLIFTSEWMWTVWLLSTALLPVAIGISILRYHLFDIDRIVSRSLAYAIVTAVLAVTFLGTNLVLQALIADTLAAGTFAVAASTLVVAALFQPVRGRVQALLDRRFNRRRVDGDRIARAFATGLRDRVDLDEVRAAMLAAADEAVAPASHGLWIRSAG